VRTGRSALAPNDDLANKSVVGRTIARPTLFFLALLILALAFALRAYGVGREAFRGDEAFSIGFVQQPLAQMFRGMALTEPNPPLYWLVLRGWLALAGTSEFAARWPSVLAGLVAVAATYRLARALAGRRVGLAAMLLAAVSPFLIWYAQDARAYSLLTALVAAALWTTWAAKRRGSGRWWAAAGGLWWLALFTHYFAALPLALAGAALLFTPAAGRAWRGAVTAGLAVGLAYLPWLLYTGPLLAGQSKNWIQPPSLLEALWRMSVAASSGPASAGASAGLQVAGGVLFIALAGLGTIFALRQRPAAALWLLAAGVGPPVALWLISLARPVFVEQYFISSLPPLLSLAAWGVSALPVRRLAASGRRLAGPGLRLAGLALWAAIALAAAQNHYFNPAFAKSADWRGLVSYLAQTARPGEVVVVNLPDPAFYLYYHGSMPVVTSPPAPLAQAGQAATLSQLSRLRDQYEHIRFLFHPSPDYDPDGFVGHWLDACCELLDDRVVLGFRIQSYDTPSGSLAARQPAVTDFAGGTRLTGYRLADARLAAGQTLHLTLYWSTAQPITASYTVFVHLLAPDGFNVLGADSLPAGGRRPTDQWALNTDVIDAHPIGLPADLPPGEYQLEVGLYQLASGQRLPIISGPARGGDALRLPLIVHVSAR